MKGLVGRALTEDYGLKFLEINLMFLVKYLLSNERKLMDFGACNDNRFHPLITEIEELRGLLKILQRSPFWVDNYGRN